MTLSRGSALTTVLTVVAATGALAFAGYTTFGGKSLCSLMACDGASSSTTSAQVAIGNETHECPFHDQIAANHKSAGACASKSGCGSSCSEQQVAGAFVTYNASFPVAVPVAFNDSTQVCPSTLVKASNTTCEKSASACCSGAKAQTVAASNETKSCASSCSEKAAQTIAASNETKNCASSCSEKAAQTIAASNETKSCASSCSEKAAQTIAASNETKSASGCCPLGALKAQTVAASTEKTECSKTLAAANSQCSGAKSCDPAACAAKGCDPSQCDPSQCKDRVAGHAAFVTMQAAFPVAIPAAFNDQKEVCPSTLVKSASSCSSKVSDAASAGCPYAAAQAQTIAASTETKSDAGCCKGSGVRADGKACCGACTKTAETESTSAAQASEKSEG